MVSMDIYDKNDFYFESTYFGRINLNWWAMVSSFLSIFGLLFGSLWIYEPISSETNKWIGFFTFLPIFFFRLLGWQFIILATVELSLILVVAILITNVAILYLVQSSQLSIEPLTSAVLSLVLPMYKLPSTSVDRTVSVKALTLLITCGNVLIVLSLILIFVLHSFGVYNPWDCNNKRKIIFQEEWFHPTFWTLLSVFAAATIPSIMLYINTMQKLLTLKKKMR